jgi:hypothetical protein
MTFGRKLAAEASFARVVLFYVAPATKEAGVYKNPCPLGSSVTIF